MPHLNPTWQLAVATAGALLALTVGLRLAGWRKSSAAAAEAVLVTALYAAWQLIGTITHRDVGGARHNALTVIGVERFLHLPSELSMQQAVLGHHWLVQLANGYYLYGHFNPTIALLVWLWWRHRDHYARIRLLLCSLTAVAFVVHFWAVAPPRLMPELGFHDVAAEYGQSVYGSFGQGIPGQLLAMPSLHVGWAVLVGYAVVTCSRSRWRWLVLGHPVLMAFDVVVTANHWWLDGIVSTLILVGCIALTRRLRRMSVRRVMGTETEYGVSTPTDSSVNPMMASSQVVNGYAGTFAEGQTRDRRTRWDFEEENPLRDARGFEVGIGGSDHYPGEPDEELGLANVILTNGARLYVDHAHPEYSTPEVTTPRDLVLWDKAGERVMRVAAERALLMPGSAAIRLYKNNTDNKGASYGTHENYLMARQTPFAEIVRHLTPFFVSRQAVVGAGRVGIGQDGREHGFQLSQRADFFEVEVGLETTLKRPIINTRDEPHADPEKYRRLHVIIGDANLAETSTYLKVGTTCLVLAMIEDGWLRQNGPDLGLESPVAALRAISHDASLTATVPLRDGRTITALELQLAYCEQAKKHVEDRYGSDVDPQTADVLARWESTLDRLAMDPMSLADELDWVAKLALLEGYRQREGLGWDAPKLHLVDLQYSDVRADKGLYNRLVARGSMRTLVSEQEVERAVAEPPEDTRAYFRGRCLAKFPTQVAAASWDSVIFDVGRESLQRVPTMEPLRGSKAHVGELLDECDSALELVERLAGNR